MSYQPPPQPPGGTPPPPPPPGQWGPPSGSNPGFDPKSVNPLDWAILGIGFLLFIFSFFDYYSWDFPGVKIGGQSIGGGSYSWSAWHFSHGLFIAWFAFLFGLAAAVLVALQLLVPSFKLPVSNRVAATGLFAASFVLYIIAIFAHSDFGPDGGHGFSFWLSLILSLVGTVLSLARAQQTGETFPGALSALPNVGAMIKVGPKAPGGGHPQAGPGIAPPPAPGYAPPPPPPNPGYAPPPPPPAPGTPPPPPPGYGPPRQ
jgi:hypothetical protein